MGILNNIKKIKKQIDDSSKIFIMAHRDLDLDALGSSLGMYKYAEHLGKEVFLVIDDERSEAAVSKVMQEIEDNTNIITGKKAEKLIDNKSLLLILDTNKRDLLQNPDLLYKFNRVMTIDHHEVGDNSITEGVQFIDSTSPSASEMIADFLREVGFVIDSFLATTLLSGIILDTNNYVLKTNSNTFYLSYYLTTCGAKPKNVQYLLKQDLNEYVSRQKIIARAKIVKNIAITHGMKNEIYQREQLAKTADSLLMFSGIEASFVIAKTSGSDIGISARSMGDINVGEVLSKVGGGGNRYEAAARIPDSTIDKVEEQILKTIDKK